MFVEITKSLHYFRTEGTNQENITNEMLLGRGRPEHINSGVVKLEKKNS